MSDHACPTCQNAYDGDGRSPCPNCLNAPLRSAMSAFVTKDSGQREDFETGARRDVQTGKPRYDLVPVPALKRLAELYARGAEKYGEHNWQKGMPFSRVMASLLRHAFSYLEGDRSEDHLCAIGFNAFALIYYEEEILKGRLPQALDDISPISPTVPTQEAK